MSGISPLLFYVLALQIYNIILYLQQKNKIIFNYLFIYQVIVATKMQLCIIIATNVMRKNRIIKNVVRICVKYLTQKTNKVYFIHNLHIRRHPCCSLPEFRR